MPVAPIGVVDLSSVTDRLIAILTDCVDQSSLWNPNNLGVNPGPQFTIHVSGASPESVRNQGDCQLTLYLFHVVEDKFQKNATPVGKISPAQPPVTYVPLALDLYYLLTAFEKGSYVHEQQTMTIAMRCFHDHPIVKMDVVFGAQVVKEEFTLTMETESSDELSRLWQSFAVPPRFSAVYKASVVLVSPETTIGPPAPKPTHLSITADPALLPFADGGQVIGTARTFRFRKLDGTLSDPVDMSPATAVPDQTFFLYGVDLNKPTASHVFLSSPGTPDVDITTWLNGAQTAGRYTLLLPNAIGAPPLASPPPGIYQLSVGDVGGSRSSKTPFSVGPRIDGPAGVPILPPGPAFAITGIGFTAGQTQVQLGTTPLTLGPVGNGFFQVNGPGTNIDFRAPAGFPAGVHPVRIRVNGVEADPSWWIQI